MTFIFKQFTPIFIGLLMIVSVRETMAAHVTVQTAEQTMTLNAKQVPLKSILRKISTYGIQIKIDPEINPLVTANFENKDLVTAFRQIVQGYNHAFVWRKDVLGRSLLYEVAIYRHNRLEEASLVRQPAMRNIEKDPVTGQLYVKNKVLIRFDKTISKERIAAALRSLNATMALIHKDLGLYEITLPDDSDMVDALAVFKKEEGVVSAEPDYAYESHDPAWYPGMGTDIPQAQSSSANTDGSFPVAILDSGLDSGFMPQVLNLASFDAVSPGEDITDTTGHGTQMAMIASGRVSPMGTESGAFSNPVVSIRAFDENGFTSNAVLIRSIDFAAKNGAKVLSLSWGAETDNQFLELAMKYAHSTGMQIVAAAGNSPTGRPVYPAAYEWVMSVSALAPDGSKWDRSNFGDFVDTAAPGFAHFPIGHKGEPGTYAGTSISTAFIAGKLAAYLRAHPQSDRTIMNKPSE